MNTLLRFSTLLLLLGTLFITCKQTSTTTPTPTPPVVVAPQAAPSITSISPMKAVSGTELTITGQNLQKAQVKINGQTATVTSIDATATSMTVVVPDFTTPLSTTLDVGLTVTTSGGTSNSLVVTIAPQAEITQLPVPNGLIPGGPLSLTVSNVSGMTGIDFMDGNGVVKATIPASDFLPSTPNSSSAIPGRIMVKVPVSVSAGGIRVNTDYGPGKTLKINKLYGNDAITAANVATNVGTITTGTISDGCNPKAFFYCVPLPNGSSYPYDRFAPSTSEKDIPDSSRLVLGFKNLGSPPPYTSAPYPCSETAIYYSTQPMGNAQYRVFNGQFNGGNGGEISVNPFITLKLEWNGQAYTGAVIVEIGETISQIDYRTIISKGDRYIGSRLTNGDIYAYSVTTGKKIKLCSQTAYTKAGTTIDCSTCN